MHLRPLTMWQSTLIGAAISGLTMWLFVHFGTNNLHGAAAWVSAWILVAGALCLGAWGGASVGRRDLRRENNILFAAVVGAIGGGICGAAYVLLMGLAFVVTYGGAPVSFGDGLVLVVAFPVFALLGAFVGTIPGAILGATTSFLLERMTTRPRHWPPLRSLE